jgi:hypothetical protein
MFRVPDHQLSQAEEKPMTIEMYFRWMKAWEWFATHDFSQLPDGFYGLLNHAWQLQRDSTPPEDLARFADAWSREKIDFTNDPEYQAFVRMMEQEKYRKKGE